MVVVLISQRVGVGLWWFWWWGWRGGGGYPVVETGSQLVVVDGGVVGW